MAFDNLCKLLAEKHPELFAAWVLGQPIQTTQVLKSEFDSKGIDMILTGMLFKSKALTL